MQRLVWASAVAMTLGGCATTPTTKVSDVPTPPPSPAAITAESLAAHIAALPTQRHPGPGLERTERQIEQVLRDYGYEPRREPLMWLGSATSPQTFHNVIAEVRGETRPEEIVLIGAHFDAVRGSPGADDNASGTAALLELARRLHGSRPGRTLRFAFFNLEEFGLIGSYQHARQAAERGERIVAMLSLEMLGYYSSEPGSQRSPLPPVPGFFTPPTTGENIVLVANRASAELARTVASAMAEAEPASLPFVVDFIPGGGEMAPDVRRSDHAAFWDAGIPAVMVTDTANFRNPHYHKASDTLETLDLPRMAATVRGLEAAVRRLSRE